MSNNSPIRAYHFVGATLRDGSPIPPDGVWLEYDKPLRICQSGLHASKHSYDALTYAPGNTLCLVWSAGEVIEQNDKLCSSRRLIVARFDAEALLWEQSRLSALSVIDKWNCPQVVRDYLETGRADLRSAAWSAAESAA